MPTDYASVTPDYSAPYTQAVLELMSRGWTQKEIAQTANAHQSCISLISRGLLHAHGPSYRVAQTLIMMSHSRMPPPSFRTTWVRKSKAPPLVHPDILQAS